jgi:adenylate kinase
MDIVLFGRQGSGKGTLGVALCERYGLMPFVTGDELRKLAKDPSPLGEKVKSIIEAGHLVPNDVVMEIIEYFMKNLPGGKSVLFDGIPRKMEQAETFNALMQRLNRPFKGVLLSISEATAWQRLATRRICEKCKAVYPSVYDKPACEVCGGALITRNDDTNEEAIRNRLEAYEKETVPVIEQYKKEGNMLRIEGEGSIEEVKQRAFSELDRFLLQA